MSGRNVRIVCVTVLTLVQFVLTSCSSRLPGEPDVTPTPALTPEAGKIVTGYYLRVMDSDGSHMRLLELSGVAPRWSPDGTQILFAAFEGAPGTRAEEIRLERGYPPSAVMVVNNDGTNLRVIKGDTVGGTDPDWSSSGEQMVFVSAHLGKRPSVFIMDSDGSNVRLLIDCEDIEGGCSYPRWSPDGAKIAFYSNGRLELVNVNGSGREVLLRSAGHMLEWSPDGSELLFAQRGSICVIQSDGSDLREIGHIEKDETIIYPTWSPSGEQILYGLQYRDWENWENTFGPPEPPGYRTETWVMTRDGTVELRIDEAFAMQPDWWGPSP